MLETGWEIWVSPKSMEELGTEAEGCSTPAWNLEGQIAEFSIWTPLALNSLCALCFREFHRAGNHSILSLGLLPLPVQTPPSLSRNPLFSTNFKLLPPAQSSVAESPSEKQAHAQILTGLQGASAFLVEPNKALAIPSPGPGHY